MTYVNSNKFAIQINSTKIAITILLPIRAN